MNLIGENINNIIDNPDRYIDTWVGKAASIKTYIDKKYLSKNKFVFDVSERINTYSEEKENLYFYFAPITLPKTETLYFSMNYQENILVGNGAKFTIYQLKDNFNEYMKNVEETTTWQDYVVGFDEIIIKKQFAKENQTIQREIKINADTTQILVVFEPDFFTIPGLTDYPLASQNLRYNFNDLFATEPEIVIFEAIPGTSGWGSIWQEMFELKKITYFLSEEVPEIPSTLVDYDLSQVWLCERNIYAENEETLLYKKNKLYALETSIDYSNNTYEIMGWKEINISKEKIDNGYSHYYFNGWSLLVKEMLFLSQWTQGSLFQGSIEFGDIVFSTISYEWSSADGENAIDNEFKFNKKGMYITNNEEGFAREISANKDISTNLQTGENIWHLTPNGQWVKLLEVKEIRMGNYHILNEENKINFYKRGE